MNETNDLPYPELFPIIHPLERPAQEVYERIPKFFWNELANNYDFHLPQGYMTPEKLKQAIVQLKRHKVVQTYDANVLFRKYDITNFATQKIIDLDDKKRCAIFWIMNAAAFLLLNKFLETPDPDIESCALKCFNIAHDYKFAWRERAGRRKGGNARSRQIDKDKAWLFEIWKGFKETKKMDPGQAACELRDCQKVQKNVSMKDKYKTSTLLKWCREWKKEYKNIRKNNKK